MAKISLTPAELRAQSAEMASLKSEYESMFQGVNGILDDVNQNWSANLANNFAGKITIAQNKFASVTSMLQTGADITQRSAATFESVDGQLASAFAGGELADAARNAGMVSTAGVMGAAITGAAVAEGVKVVEEFGNGTVHEGGGKSFGRGLTLDYVMDEFKKTVKQGWEDSGNLLRYVDKQRETKIGKAIEGEYDKIANQIKEATGDTTMKDVKATYDIAVDIITGEVSWDTTKTYLKTIGMKDVKIAAIIETAKLATDENSYLVKRNDELNNRAADCFVKGDIAGGLYCIGGNFVETVGKGVCDVGGRLIGRVPGVKAANTVIKNITGVDVGKTVNEFNASIGDAVSAGVDAGQKFVSKTASELGKTVSSGLKHAGNGLKSIGDTIGKWFG